MDTDWIVAGAGHNGLTAACYLAKAGERVLALDRDVIAGGGASTREVTIPGVKHNLHAMRIVSAAFETVATELELRRYGVDILTNDAYCATIFDDGRALVRYQDVDRMVAEIARFNGHDARAYRDLYYESTGIREAMIAARRAWPALPGGPPPVDTARPLSANLRRWYYADLLSVLREVFDDPAVQVSMRGSLQAVSYPADVPLTGLNLVQNLMLAHVSPPGLIRGGSSQVARALERILAEHGGAVRTGAEVREVLIEGGRAVGVALANGERLMARKGVIAGFGHKVLLDVVDDTLLPGDFVEPIRCFRGEEIVLFNVHAAVRGPIRYRAAADNPDVDTAFDVSFGISSLADLRDQYNDIRAERVPGKVAGFCDIPSVWDASYAPAGIHSVDIGANVPYPIAGDAARWDTVTAEYGERLVAAWRERTWTAPEDILGTFTYSPLDIVRGNPSFFEGSPLQGSPLPDQAGLFRPAYGWAEYATPVAGLYVTGGTAYPMGGLNGLPGHHCATRIARDYGIPRWWAPIPGFADEPA